jgi:tryptophanyl-tRNA synthetase
MTKPIILSGMQPTGDGKLHLGNLEGALKNWVSLQDKYEMYLCIVDWHALTSDYDKTKGLKNRILQVALDYLASGLEPDKCAIFVQSLVKEHAELHLLLSMITPLGWLERVPSYKEKKEELGLDNYGFLGYPLLQAADILIYKAQFVPVGKDQLPHIELAREIARRFNSLYGKVFPEPEGLLGKYPTILGTDGKKMSKSYENDIAIADSEEVTAKKVSKMYTDPEKIHKGDAGHPEGCPVYMLHKIYTPELDFKIIHTDCISGKLGCVECKKILISNMNRGLAPIRKKRAELEKNFDYVKNVLVSGSDKARSKAQKTMAEVRKVMGMIDG